MTFHLLLYLSVFICLTGLVLKISKWFSYKVNTSENDISTRQRISAAIKGTAHSVFSKKIILIIKSFVMDILLQKKIFEKNMLAWIAHMFIFNGFILLFLMHALESSISENLFQDYYSTINPFLFLRNLFGIMVLTGTGIAFFKRIILKSSRINSNREDWFTLFIIAFIILSGIFLESAKISSYSEFQNMAEDYGDVDNKEEMQALESYWVKSYGIVSPNINNTFDRKTLLLGSEIHDMSCGECHSPAKWAFASFSTAKTLKPISLSLDKAGGVALLWYIHIIACFFFLAWLPFSKMFHMIASPIILMTNAAMQQEKLTPANILTRQIIELDACTHCGTCNLDCSSIMFFESLQNQFILPSEKINFLKNIASGKKFDIKYLKNIQKGIYLCTNCERCTKICPSGINLKELFANARDNLLQKKIPEPYIYSQLSFALTLENKFSDEHLEALKSVDLLLKSSFKSLKDINKTLSLKKTKALANITYKSCYCCQSCTNICPVVGAYKKSNEVVDIMPHQIIYSLGVGLLDIALGAKMIWDCSGCYLCQEYCPQRVEICDIFYNLKNLAIKQITH